MTPFEVTTTQCSWQSGVLPRAVSRHDPGGSSANSAVIESGVGPGPQSTVLVGGGAGGLQPHPAVIAASVTRTTTGRETRMPQD